MDDIELTKTLPTKLLELLEEKNFTQFAQLLDNKDDPFDVNHFYDDPYKGTLLDIACRSSGNHEFVKKLLEHGAEINRVNEKSGLAPMHEAVQNSDVDTVNVLMADEKCNVHIFDFQFCTPVVRAALANRRDILSTLLGNEKVTLVSWTAEDVLKITDSWICGENTDHRETPSTDECCLPPNVVCNLEQFEFSSSRVDTESESEEDENKTSICSNDDLSDSSSPQIKLLHWLKTQNLYEFRDIFEQSENTVDVNHFYTSENGTLLDIACRTKNNSAFIEFLKENNAEINFRNPTRHGRSPLHTAVEYADEETLKILLGYENCDVNVTDDYGETPLHIAAKRDKPRAAEILLDQEGIQINKLNHNHEPALYLALQQNHLEIIRRLLKCPNIQLNMKQDPEDLTCERIIAQRYPQWGRESPRSIRDPQIDELFSLLYENRTKSFIEQVDSNVFKLPCADDGFFTYLQYACERGFSDVVDKLLQLGIDPNQTCPNNTSTPIMISAAKGYHKTVARLLKAPGISLDQSNNNKETVLHTLVRGLLASQFHGAKNLKDPERNYHICLEYILPRTRKIVNYSDRDGNIALYYAAKSNDKKIILLLLNAGSYICHKNHTEDIVLQSINPAILREYLDGCISTNDESNEQSGYQIILNCEIFKPPVGHPEIPETEPLLLLNKAPKSRYLLQHPVLTSFLDLKWYTLKKFYNLNFALRLVFILLLSSYIVGLLFGSTTFPPSDCVFEKISNATSPREPCSVYRGCDCNFQRTFINNDTGPGIQRNISICNNLLGNATSMESNSYICCSFNKSTGNSNNSPPSGSESADYVVQIPPNMSCKRCQQSSNGIRQHHDQIISVLRWLTMIFWVIFVIMEILQVFVSPRRYLCSLENWIALGIASATIYLLCVCQRQDFNTGANNWTYQIAVFAIFVSYIGLFFLLGKHPALSTNTEIFKTVSVNFIKFLICYSFLMIAFTGSFIISCKYNTNDGHEEEETIATYNNPAGSIIRTFMMMTGDFDAECVLKGDQLTVGHILFAVFVLLVTIVLQNLLNGMAVDDIQKIRKDAQLLAILSQIRFTWYIENAIALDFSDLMTSFNRWCRKYPKTIERLSLNNFPFFHKMTHLCLDTLPDCKIRILPNKNNAVRFAGASDCHSLKYSDWKIDTDIVESAVKILKKKNSNKNKKSDLKKNRDSGDFDGIRSN